MRKGSVSIGTTLGRLTVIDKTDGAAGKHQRLICQCSCGSINDRDVLAANNILKFALNPKNKTTDGMSGVACGDVGVSQVDEAGTVSGRSLRP